MGNPVNSRCTACIHVDFLKKKKKTQPLPFLLHRSDTPETPGPEKHLWGYLCHTCQQETKQKSHLKWLLWVTVCIQHKIHSQETLNLKGAMHTVFDITAYCVPSDLLFDQPECCPPTQTDMTANCAPDDLLFGQQDCCLPMQTDIRAHCVVDNLLFGQPDCCPLTQTDTHKKSEHTV